MIKNIEAKSILSKLNRNDSMFGISYNMNLYRGCQHGCIYCDTRSDCYGIGDISQISVKTNAIELLHKELRSKRKKGTIGTGSMNDPYMPIEAELGITRKALTEIADVKFPVHVITKGDIVTRDYDLLQEIGKTYAAVSVTITTFDDKLAKKIEPNAPNTSDRFKVLKFLAEKGIYTGITLMPLLPYVNDTEKNLISIIRKAYDMGVSYIIPMFGLTLRKGNREYLYRVFEKEFPELRNTYELAFKEQYVCNSANYRQLERCFYTEAAKYNIAYRMRFYQPEPDPQLSLF